MKDKRQFIVWGLGRFGSSVAETLTSLGHEVLGIDNNEDVVENMADKLTHAVVCDVIDEKTVNSLGIRNFDVGVVAIGNLVDPPATMINSAGDYVVCYIVARVTDGKDWLDRAIAARHAK